MRKIGVVIGRFQTPTLSIAHNTLLSHAKHNSDLVICGIGVSPLDGKSARNPLTFEQRTYNIKTAWCDSNFMIVPVFDDPSDAMWFERLDDIIEKLTVSGDEVTLYGGHDSIIIAYRNQSCPKYDTEIVELGASKRATDIRKEINICNGMDFMVGQTWALNAQYPHVYPTVDIAVYRRRTPDTTKADMLLIERADTHQWVFPGGFVDPEDLSYEYAAKRELFEETGIICEGRMQHVGSYLIKDWRYEKECDKIMTSLFTTEYSFGGVKMKKDEVASYVWIEMNKESYPEKLAMHHRKLWSSAMNYILSFGD